MPATKQNPEQRNRNHNGSQAQGQLSASLQNAHQEYCILTWHTSSKFVRELLYQHVVQVLL